MKNLTKNNNILNYLAPVCFSGAFLLLFFLIFQRFFYIQNIGFLINELIFSSKPIMVTILDCNDYIDKYVCQFKNPHSPIMVGIFSVYNYIQLFLLFGLILVIVWLEESLLSAGLYKFSKFRFSRIYLNKSERFELLGKLDSRVRGGDLKLSHAPTLEFIWTIVPIFLLIFIAWPSFGLLYSIEESINPLYNITVTGSQWFWTYEYSDFNLHLIIEKIIQNSDIFKLLNFLNDYTTEEITNFFFDETVSEGQKNNFINQLKKFNFEVPSISLVIEDIEKHISFDCNIVSEDFLPFGYPRLLSTDNVLVLPSETPIRFLITSNDVIHSWSVPNFGIKVDAVPGRLNQAFLNTDFCGTSWGQCSELCGVNHGYMPIEVRVLPIDEFLFFIKLKAREILQENDIFSQILNKAFVNNKELLSLIKQSRKFKIN